jgi:acyl-coenzyme A thioesterase PaaI-like protein
VHRPDARIFHHDLCFGCGQANVFGLQLELEAQPGGGVEGRFFVKQDHQGPPGFAHGGVIAAALDEAMALLLHGEQTTALTGRLAVDLIAPAPVGTFMTVRAEQVDSADRKLTLRAEAVVEGEVVARGAGVFIRSEPGGDSGAGGDPSG